MIWSIIGVTLLWAFIYLRRKKILRFIVITILSLFWLIPSELLGWQDYWWVSWIISPLMLIVAYLLSDVICYYVRALLNRRILTHILDNAKEYISFSKPCEICGADISKVKLSWDYKLAGGITNEEELFSKALVIDNCCEDKEDYIRYMVRSSYMEIVVLNKDKIDRIQNI